jgi:hypothetical protein
LESALAESYSEEHDGYSQRGTIAGALMVLLADGGGGL